MKNNNVFKNYVLPYTIKLDKNYIDNLNNNSVSKLKDISNNKFNNIVQCDNNSDQ